VEGFEGVGDPNGSTVGGNLHLTLNDRRSCASLESLPDESMPVGAFASKRKEQLSTVDLA
jgi:hypothetical protein